MRATFATGALLVVAALAVGFGCRAFATRPSGPARLEEAR
jgi:hypothetical protein